MRYCDGGSFAGNNDTVQQYKGSRLHWRGKRVREAIQADLMGSQGMSSATDLIVSGCSAGGLATYLHTDQWCDALHQKQPGAKCAGLPDSGFFLDYQDPTVPCSPPSSGDTANTANSEFNGTAGRLGSTINGNYHCGLKWTAVTQNVSAGVNADCVAAHGPDDSWKCMFAEHSSEHIKTPVFAMQSQYDAWQTGHVQGNGGDAKTQVLGNNITRIIQDTLMRRNKESGAFLDSCHHHCGSWNSIRIDGDLVSTAIQKWYNGIGSPNNKKLWNQGQKYPCDACCKP